MGILIISSFQVHILTKYKQFMALSLIDRYAKEVENQGGQLHPSSTQVMEPTLPHQPQAQPKNEEPDVSEEQKNTQDPAELREESSPPATEQNTGETIA